MPRCWPGVCGALLAGGGPRSPAVEEAFDVVPVSAPDPHVPPPGGGCERAVIAVSASDSGMISLMIGGPCLINPLLSSSQELPPPLSLNWIHPPASRLLHPCYNPVLLRDPPHKQLLSGVPTSCNYSMW